MVNNRQYLDDLTAEQYYFIERLMKRMPKYVLIQAFHNHFHCWITYKHINAVAYSVDYKITKSLGAAVNKFIVKYYGKVTNETISKALDKKFHLGMTGQEVSRYSVAVLGLEYVSVRARSYFEVFDYYTKERVYRGTAKQLSEWLECSLQNVYSRLADNTFVTKNGVKYGLKEVDICED